MPEYPYSSRGGAEFEQLVARILRQAGLRVQRRQSRVGLQPNLILTGNGNSYVVEMKRSTEGRRDRLIPLLSQAIVQVKAVARQFSGNVIPIAVVCAPRVSAAVAEHAKEFAVRYAPEVGVGIIDLEGFRSFAGHGLEQLDAQPSPRPLLRKQLDRPRYVPHLFSDLNQWMLKILLASHIPESLLSAPRMKFRSASQLANAASVSVMSASRLIRQLAAEGFLSEREDHLRVVRVDDLMRRWLAASQQAVREVPVRWIIKKDMNQLLGSIESYSRGLDWSSISNRKGRGVPAGKGSPRICVGLFAAADALGLGFVRGVPPHLYLEHFDHDVVRKLGLSAEDVVQSPDVYIRIPANNEAVFRAAVRRGGLPVADVLQVWLDVSSSPARGGAQAKEIRRRVLGPLFGEKSDDEL